MIKGITSTNPHLTVSGLIGDYMNMSTPSAGMVRYNGNSSSLEVYDGSYWRTMHNYQSVDLTNQATEAINWVIRKMQEEDKIKMLAESHPAIKIAFENFKRAEQQLEATIHLSKEHDLQTTN